MTRLLEMKAAMTDEQPLDQHPLLHSRLHRWHPRGNSTMMQIISQMEECLPTVLSKDPGYGPVVEAEAEAEVTMGPRMEFYSSPVICKTPKALLLGVAALLTWVDMVITVLDLESAVKIMSSRMITQQTVTTVAFHFHFLYLYLAPVATILVMFTAMR